MRRTIELLSLRRPDSGRSRNCSLSVRLTVGVVLSAGFGASGPALHAAALSKYTVQSLLKRGDKVGDTTIRAQYGFEVDGLNDNGQLLFVAYTANTETLFQYAGGKFSPIVGPGIPTPLSSGHWFQGDVFSPVSMNRNGNAVFAMFNYGANAWGGTFQWDAKAGQTTAVALKGMPAVNDLTYNQPGFPRPAINNREEIAFPAEVKNPAGKVLGVGLFFRGPDGRIQPVALPGQEASDGVALNNAYYASMADDGRIAFLARRYRQLRPSAYVSELGQLIPIAVVGTDAPGGGKITEVNQLWVNNKNRDILLELILNDLDTGPHALYRWSNGRLSPLVVPGKAMPGGGQFESLQYLSVSFPNEAGQHAFYGLITDGGVSRTAAYLLDVDGTLTPILKGGDTTNELGPIARIGDPDEGQDGGGFGIALNGKGQVAVILKPVSGPQNLALLTPVSP